MFTHCTVYLFLQLMKEVPSVVDVKNLAHRLSTAGMEAHEDTDSGE